MAVDVYGARIRETTNTPGTGTLTLNGAVTGRKAFSTLGIGSTCTYMLEDANGSAWERGRGTVGSGTLARTTVYESTNANAAISLTGGTHRIFVTESADLYDSIVVTPEQYGAAGDGTTDDTAAIQAALDTGAAVVYCHNVYKTTDTLQLQSNQILQGPPRSTYVFDITPTTEPRIIFLPASNSKPCIKNASGTNNNGCIGMGFELAHNTNTGIQFASTYGNVVKQCVFYGTMNIAIMMHESYVCDFWDVVVCGASIKSFCIYVSEMSNAVSIRRLHTSGYPNDNAVCMYGIAIRDGYAHTISDCVIQGATIGIATHGTKSVIIDNPYFENTLCNARFGDAGSGPNGSGVMVRGGLWGECYASHPQYAHRGPVLYLNCGRSTFDTYSCQSTADNTTARGPWPVVMSNYCDKLVFNNPIHYGNDGAGGTQAMFFREEASSSPSFTVLGSVYGTHGATEIILKEDSSYGLNCAAIRVSGTTISAVAYQPAVIFAAVDSLLQTALPAGASLVL